MQLGNDVWMIDIAMTGGREFHVGWLATAVHSSKTIFFTATKKLLRPFCCACITEIEADRYYHLLSNDSDDHINMRKTFFSFFFLEATSKMVDFW